MTSVITVMAAEVYREFQVQRGMLPSWNTLTNASAVKPDGGIQVTFGAAASVSLLKAVTVAQAKGTSQRTASNAAAARTATRPGLILRTFLRRAAGPAEAVRGRARVSVAMAMHSCGG